MHLPQGRVAVGCLQHQLHALQILSLSMLLAAVASYKVLSTLQRHAVHVCPSCLPNAELSAVQRQSSMKPLLSTCALDDCGCAGSTQDEVSSMVHASIQEAKISGNDRAVAWDGQTKSGPGLATQLKAVAENRVQPVSMLHALQASCMSSKHLARWCKRMLSLQSHMSWAASGLDIDCSEVCSGSLICIAAASTVAWQLLPALQLCPLLSCRHLHVPARDWMQSSAHARAHACSPSPDLMQGCLHAGASRSAKSRATKAAGAFPDHGPCSRGWPRPLPAPSPRQTAG